MTEEKRLLRAVQRLVADRELTARLAAAPRETVLSELRISRESYEALVAIVPALLVGGLLLVSGSGVPGTDPSGVIRPEWGNWGFP